MSSHSEIAEFIWRIADHLRGDYEKNDNEDVILPFTLLRRLDCVLEPTREKVRETEARYAGKIKDEATRKWLLTEAAGVPFYNRSRFSLVELLKNPDQIKENFGAYLDGFSDNIKEILYNFSGGEEKGLAPIYETLARKKLLYLITQEFAAETLDLHPERVSNHDMGLIYEYLIRKFKEGAAAGEQFTPRDVVQLLVQLVFADVEHEIKTYGKLISIYDPACGTGGMLTVAKDYLVSQWRLDPGNIFLYGQELREKTYAICKADALMKGEDTDYIKQGNTLSEDQLIGQKFQFMLANPEFGTDWKKIESHIRNEAARGAEGRFGAGLPDIGDASLLFLQHMISKMTPPHQGGSVIGIVFNGSPLFNGDAGSGWSDIRKWIITNDWLDAIVALPEDMFYNTNIATYLWIVRNNKPAARRGKIMLVNGNQPRFRTLMRRNLGKKRVELTAATIAELVRVYRAGQAVPKLAQVFDLQDFGFTRVIVERPLRLRYEINADRLAALRQSSAFRALADANKLGAAALARGQEKQRALLAALEAVKPLCPCRDDRLFLQAVAKALPYPLTAQLINALRANLAVTDASAEKALLKPLEARFDRAKAERHPGDWYATDSALRDEERIALKTDIDAYFAREVRPYAPDAWMVSARNRVGYEISFTRYFYEYKPPRDLAAILADLAALDNEAERLQTELRG